MLKRLLTAAGVDYTQWRALLRAYMMIDYAALRGVYGATATNHAVKQILVTGVAFMMLSFTPALIIWNTTDRFFAGIVLVTSTWALATMTTVAMATTLVAPDDYLVVGFRPISSRTYLAVRTTALLIHAGETAVLSGYFPVAAFLTHDGISWSLAAGAAIAVGATTFATTTTIVLTYGWLLDRLGAVRMRRVVTYAQAVVGLGVVAGLGSLWFAFVDFGDLGLRFSIKDIALPRATWVLGYPGTWFGAFVPIAGGGAGTLEWRALGLAVTFMSVVALLLRGRVSERYFSHAAQLALDTTAPAVRQDPAWPSLRRERRAVLLLMRHQLRANLEMQTSVVMGYVMALLFMGAAIYIEGRPTDPFATSFRDAAGSGFVMVIGFAMTPSSLWQSIARCSTPQAVWPFFTTAADRVRIVLGAQDAVALMSLAPLLLLSVGIHTWAFGHAGHAVLYTLFLGLFAYVQLQLAVFTDPIVPFSRPPLQASGGLPFQGRGFLTLLVAGPIWALISIAFFGGLFGFAGAFIGLVLVSLLLNRVTRRRVLKNAYPES